MLIAVVRTGTNSNALIQAVSYAIVLPCVCAFISFKIYEICILIRAVIILSNKIIAVRRREISKHLLVHDRNLAFYSNIAAILSCSRFGSGHQDPAVKEVLAWTALSEIIIGRPEAAYISSIFGSDCGVIICAAGYFAISCIISTFGQRAGIIRRKSARITPSICWIIIVMCDLPCAACICSSVVELQCVFSSVEVYIHNGRSVRRNNTAVIRVILFVNKTFTCSIVFIGHRDKHILSVHADSGVSNGCFKNISHIGVGCCILNGDGFYKVITSGKALFPDQHAETSTRYLCPLSPDVSCFGDRLIGIYRCCTSLVSIPSVKDISRACRGRYLSQAGLCESLLILNKQWWSVCSAIPVEDQPMAVSYLCHQDQGGILCCQTLTSHIDFFTILIYWRRSWFGIHFHPAFEMSGVAFLFFIFTCCTVVRRVCELHCIWNWGGCFSVEHLVRKDGYCQFVKVGNVIRLEHHSVEVYLVAICHRSCIQKCFDLAANFFNIQSVFCIINGICLFLGPSFEDLTSIQGDTGIVDVDIRLSGVDLVLGKAHFCNKSRSVRIIEINVQTCIGVNAFYHYINREFLCLELNSFLGSICVFNDLCDKFFFFLIFFDMQYLSVAVLKHSCCIHLNVYRFERLNLFVFCVVECDINCFYFFNVLCFVTESFVDSVNNRFDFDFFNLHSCTFGECVYIRLDVNHNAAGNTYEMLRREDDLRNLFYRLNTQDFLKLFNSFEHFGSFLLERIEPFKLFSKSFEVFSLFNDFDLFGVFLQIFNDLFRCVFFGIFNNTFVIFSNIFRSGDIFTGVVNYFIRIFIQIINNFSFDFRISINGFIRVFVCWLIRYHGCIVAFIFRNCVRSCFFKGSRYFRWFIEWVCGRKCCNRSNF